MTETAPGLRQLLGNMTATFGRQVLGAVLGLLTMVVVARIYGPEGNGARALALLLPTMIATFLNLGVAPANVYHLGAGLAHPWSLFVANLKIFAGFAIAGILLGGSLIFWDAAALFPGVEPLVLWIALAIFPLMLLNSFVISMFQGLQQFRAFNLLSILRPVLLILLVGALTIAGIRDVSWLIAAQFVTELSLLLVSLVVLIPRLRRDRGGMASDGLIHRTLAYGWKAHLSNVLSFVSYKADIFLVNLFHGPMSAGIYVIAVAFAEKLWLLSHAVSTVLLPRLSQLASDETARRRLTPLVARWVMVATLGGALVLALAGEVLLSVLFGREFSGALLPLWILLPGIVMGSASRVLASDVAARGRPELNMHVSLVVVFVNIAGNLVLIPAYGLVGAAAATTFAYTVNLVLRLYVYGRLSETRWLDSVFPRRDDIRMVAAMLRRARAAR